MGTFLAIFRLTAFWVLALASSAVFAAAGTVTHISGTLSVQRPDGTVRILAQKSEVNAGDLLTTQSDSYAQINYTDGSSMTMRPNTQIRIEQYTFVQDRPQDDSSFLRLIKGGLRTVTGLVGKRGNQDAYKIGTNTATIGIRGSSGQSLVEDDDTTAHETYTGSYIMELLKDGRPTGIVLEVPEGRLARTTSDGRLEFTSDQTLQEKMRQEPVFRISGIRTKGDSPTAECVAR
jgi:FecR protein